MRVSVDSGFNVALRAHFERPGPTPNAPWGLPALYHLSSTGLATVYLGSTLGDLPSHPQPILLLLVELLMKCRARRLSSYEIVDFSDK